MKLRCAICFFLVVGPAPPAVTVINGQAVCEDHMLCVQGGDHSTALGAARLPLRSV